MSQSFDQGDPSEVPSVLPGTLIGGKYRIDGLLGRGGMGSVWSATHINLGQRVAVKLIAMRYASSREARQRFDLEAKSVAQLRSRFVVQVYDNGETPEGIPYIVMEMLEGESLDQRVTRLGALGIVETARILGQVGRALSKAHQQGIIHRDLKPENIYLARSTDEEAEIAKVLDFGIAKIKTTTDGQQSSGTRTGAVIGTPLFMSPEQARGLKSVDHRTDIYSLGMVAFTMLTGRSAFKGESFADLLVSICTQPLPSLTEAAPWLPRSLETWFQRACAREADQRFQSAQELVDALNVSALRGVAGANQAQSAQEVVESLHAAGGVGQRGALQGDSGLGAGPWFAQGDGVPPHMQPPPGHGTGGSGFDAPRTMSALEMSGAGIPRRSVVPWFLGGIGVLAVGGAALGLVLMRQPGRLGSSPASAAPQASIAVPGVGDSATAGPVLPLAASGSPVLLGAPSVEAPASPPAVASAASGASGVKPSGHAAGGAAVNPASGTAVGSGKTPVGGHAGAAGGRRGGKAASGGGGNVDLGF